LGPALTGAGGGVEHVQGKLLSWMNFGEEIIRDGMRSKSMNLKK